MALPSRRRRDLPFSVSQFHFQNIAVMRRIARLARGGVRPPKLAPDRYSRNKEAMSRCVNGMMLPTPGGAASGKNIHSEVKKLK
jgi:hypothetical protein